MQEFWLSLTLLQQIYFCIAIAFSLVLIIQIILMLFGIGSEGDVDVDLSGDGVSDVTVDTSDGFTLFSIRGIVAFFSIGGWVGYTLAPVDEALAIILSLVCGAVAFVLMALIMKAILKLQSNGNITLDKAIGKTAEVYLTVPKKDKGAGKINLLLDERLVEISAISNGDKDIPTGARVKIIGKYGDSLIVEQEENL